MRRVLTWRTAFLFLLMIVAVATAPVHASYVYLSSSTSGPPWGYIDSKLAMDAAFGAGNWQDLAYESANALDVFSSSNRFVHMDGDDSMTGAMDLFLTANRSTIESWVQGGGRLFMDAGANGQGSMDYGFGGVSLLDSFIFYPWAAVAVNPSSPLFAGPLPTGTSFTGSSFAHGYVDGPGITPLIVGTENGLDFRTVLAEKAYGNGWVLFGSMTIPAWQEPSSDDFNLLVNTLVYTATVPEPSTMAVFGLGAVIAGVRTRRIAKKQMDAGNSD
jgi:hypothetical protein